MSEPETDREERAMIEMAPADAAMVESFREAAYAIDHQRDDDPNWRPPNQIIGEAFEQRGLIVARREEVVALREAAALAGPGADRPYSTREYLRANLFDGDESGVLTVTISTLLDDLVPVVNEYAALSRSETT